MKGYCIGSSIGKCGVPHYVVLQCSLDMFDLLQLAPSKESFVELWILSIFSTTAILLHSLFISRCILACRLAFVVQKRVARLMALISIHLKWQKSVGFQVLMSKWNLWSSYPTMQESLKGCSSMTSFVLCPRKYVRRSVACVIQVLKLFSLCSARGGWYSTSFQAVVNAILCSFY